MKPAFSIIIPVYNVAPYLRACIDSVCVAVEKVERLKGFKVEKLKSFKVSKLKSFKVERLCGGVEVICVDDGSTDGSAEILDEYASRFNSSTLKPFNFETLKPFNLSTFQPFNFSTFQPFNLSTFRVLHQPNQGPSAARNAGLDAAQGEYVLFVDGDDLIHPQTLAVLHKELQEGGVDCVRYGWMREDPAKHGWCEVKSLQPRRFSLNRDDQLNAAMRFVFGGSACTACYRRATIGDVRFEPLRHNEDHVFNAAVFGRFRACLSVGVPLYYYRIRPNSLTHAVSDVQFEGILRSMPRLHEISRTWPFFGKVRRRAYGYIRSMCAGYCYANTLDVEKRMGNVAREKYLAMLRELYASPSFAPNALTRAFRLFSLHLGPLSWPIGVVIFMHGLHEAKGWMRRSMKAVLK